MNQFKFSSFCAFFILLTGNLWFSTTSMVNAAEPKREIDETTETVLEQIDRTGVLKVGIRGDVIPFGFRNNQGKLEGICFDLVKLIKDEIIQQIDRDFISTKLLISSLYNRFEIVEDELVHLECGPNTIREIEEYQITFSEPFFVSGVRFLAREDIAKKLVNSQGKNIRIGLLRYSITEQLIKEKYPRAEFDYFQGRKGALRAFQAVKRGQIDAFANDSILLLGESIAQRFPLGETTGYVITPQQPLSCEQYGFIIPLNNLEWENLINRVINSVETKKVFRGWFNAFPSESLSNHSRCLLAK